jgi:hypothetical protein
MMNDPLMQKLKNADFIVECTYTEMFFLWKINEVEKQYHWVDDTMGFWQNIGSVDGRPICISFSFATVDGLNIAFVEGTSQLVDYKMLEEWVQTHNNKTYDNGARRAWTDARNFHHIRTAIDEKKARS